MRIGRVVGQVTCSKRLPEFGVGRLVLVEILDGGCLAAWPEIVPREKPMPEALIVYDELGAGLGQLLAVSEGGEAMQPFRPKRCPVDAYASAILDTIEWEDD